MNRFYIILVILVFPSNGFLLQQNSSTGSSNSSSKSELYEVKQSFQHSINELRTDMENNLKLFASQVQTELNSAKIKTDNKEEKNDSACVDLELKYKELKDEHANLTKYYSALEEKLNLIMPLIETINNRTTLVEHGTQNMTGLKPVKDMQTVITLQQNVSEISIKVNQLSLNQQARAQDFLALYKQTVNLEKETTRSVQSLQSDLNSTNTHLKNELDRQISMLRDGFHSSLNSSTATLTKELVELKQDYNSLKEKVAVTVCTGGFHSYPSKVPFTNIKSQTGPIDTDALKNGDFKCTSAGLYMVSFTLVSNTSKVQFYIYKNDNQVIYHYISNDDHYDSGTSVMALELNVNDTVSVKPAGSRIYFSSAESCLTVIKIM